MFPENTLFRTIYCIICKLNNNVLIGAQCDSVVVIHGKRLQSIGFVTSILPYIFFTWWVNNDMNNKVSQKLEIIGFKESVKKYTTIISLFIFSITFMFYRSFRLMKYPQTKRRITTGSLNLISYHPLHNLQYLLLIFFISLYLLF